MGRREVRVALSERAGRPAVPSMLVDVDRLVGAYYDIQPDPLVPSQAVAFGTSGHRGSSLLGSFNEAHILAISEAICRFRRVRGINGPLFLGRDTHALSEPALRSAIEVLVGNDVTVLLDRATDFTPTPAMSHAILAYNAGRPDGFADGIVITPSHNPPEDGGFKYNPPSGGPAAADITDWIQDEANSLLRAGLKGVRRVPYADARSRVRGHAILDHYVADLANVVDMAAIRSSGLHLGVDPLGGAGIGYWPAIRDRYGLDLTVTNESVDPTFGFMTVDWDGRIRMDPSSPYAMARLIGLKDRYDIAFANDTDADRHGIVSGGAGLMDPNQYLSVAAAYLFEGNRDWGPDVAIGKTLVSTGMLDRIAGDLGRRLFEVPVGFKWFVDGLLDGSLGFGGEESAGASFLRRDGSVWTTDKDGIIACLLAAELTARGGRDPAARYRDLTDRFGAPAYRRIDAPATREQKAVLARLSAAQVTTSRLAGEPISAVLTVAPGNDAPIGGIKVVTEHGWFAARPSGTEDLYKVYAESFLGEPHLASILEEAQAMVSEAFARATVQGHASQPDGRIAGR
jgi:phosphoglucomutase